jgi:hypothetical protein
MMVMGLSQAGHSRKPESELYYNIHQIAKYNLQRDRFLVPRAGAGKKPSRYSPTGRPATVTSIWPGASRRFATRFVSSSVTASNRLLRLSV